jgi:prepilin-type processing-associated H-X9-DG protein
MKKSTTILIALGFACTVMLVCYGSWWWENNWRIVHIRRWGCQTNLYWISRGMLLYASDDPNHRLPPADRWCDLLVELDAPNYTSPEKFVCQLSGAVEGESSYAINKHIAGKSLDDIPHDVVLLFETDHGKDPNGRTELLKNRLFYAKKPYGKGKAKVFKNRWNQSGGAEILTTRHRKGEGCNVVFIDTHVQFVKTEDLEKLNWGNNIGTEPTKVEVKMERQAE